jgi:uncharacterized protein (DUF2147 family)
MTPVGLWQSVDDNTNEAKSEIKIIEVAGVLSGKVIKTLNDEPNDKKLCTDCKDDRKGQIIVGMEIIRGLKQEGSEFVWAGGGKILDPENGKEYTVRMTPIEGGQETSGQRLYWPLLSHSGLEQNSISILLKKQISTVTESY